MIRRETWTLPGPDELPIHGESDVPAHIEATAVIVHGYTGSKDRNIIPALGAHLANANVLCHRFTMTHAGLEKDADEVTRTDEFSRDSTAICMDNIRAVFRAISDDILPGRRAAGPTILIGHSRGGATVLGFAGRENPAGRAPIDGVVSVAGIANYWHCTEETRETLERDGYVERPFGRTAAGVIRMGPSWFEHAAETAPRALFEADIARIPCPVLLVHGEADAHVPLEQPAMIRRFLENEGIQVDVRVIPDGDHNLNALGFGTDHDNIDAPPVRLAAQDIRDFIRELE